MQGTYMAIAHHTDTQANAISHLRAFQHILVTRLGGNLPPPAIEAAMLMPCRGSRDKDEEAVWPASS